MTPHVPEPDGTPDAPGHAIAPPTPPAAAESDWSALHLRIQHALAAFLGQHRERLAAADAALVPVADAIEDFVLGGGKRLRPTFAYWGFVGAGGTDSAELIAAIASLELVHASALIHDDVIDASDTRRGEPSVHRRFADLHTGRGWGGDAAGFGRAAAILLGDLCLVWSEQLLFSSGMGAESLARARADFDDMRTEVAVGQYLDVHAQASGNISMERAGKVARYKSARYTVERPLLLGGALAGAPPAVRAAFSGYGLPLGEAFQLRDDILGVYGDPARTGKPAGDDLREGKRTFLVAAALEEAGPGDGKALLEGLGDPNLDGAGVQRLREIIRDSGALQRTEARIDELTRRALAELSTVELAGAATDALIDLAAVATQRTG